MRARFALCLLLITVAHSQEKTNLAVLAGKVVIPHDWPDEFQYSGEAPRETVEPSWRVHSDE